MENTGFTQEQLVYLDQRADKIAEKVRARLKEDRKQTEELQRLTEIVIMNAISQIQAIADIMRGFFPENDTALSGRDMPDILRRCGEAIKVLTDDLLRDLDL